MAASDEEHRSLTAVLCADVAGYSTLMRRDEAGTMASLTRMREIVLAAIESRRGRTANTAGDSIVAAFRSSLDAVRCAVEVQSVLAAGHHDADPHHPMRLRIGIHVGEIMDRGGDIFGDGVNVAARLQTMADAGGICVSDEVHALVQRLLPLTFARMPPREAKNLGMLESYAVLLGTSGRAHPAASATSASSQPSIAVLPFEDVGREAGQGYFGEGLAEDVTTALARTKGISVVARNSAFSYQGVVGRVHKVIAELGVNYVLDGTVRRSQDRVRVGVQLIDARTRREIWSERYDRALTDVFTLQDDIATQVVVTAEPQLYRAERDRLRLTPPEDLEAWDCVTRAVSHMWKATKADNDAALELLRTALNRDPTYSRALGLKAWLTLWHAHHGWNPSGLPAVLPEAFVEATRAARQEEQDPWTRLALGFALMFRREHDRAVEELQAALELNPNFTLAHACLGLTYAYGDRGPDAVKAISRAIELSPRDPFLNIFTGTLGFAHFMAGNFEAGLALSLRAAQMAPDFSGNWRGAALCAAALGLADDAREAVKRACERQSSFSVAWVEQHSPLVSAANRRKYCALLLPYGLPEKPPEPSPT